MNKKLIYLVMVAFLALMSTVSCKDMDDNYKEYLEDIPTYSPAVRNLTASSPEAGSLTLKWRSSTTPISSRLSAYS